ncbi:hypothetical protein B5G16_01775 [Alistipes sp. An66]|nr:hypothetical protein B5G16_01775 [Alistipes sp. An66]
MPHTAGSRRGILGKNRSLGTVSIERNRDREGNPQYSIGDRMPTTDVLRNHGPSFYNGARGLTLQRKGVVSSGGKRREEMKIRRHNPFSGLHHPSQLERNGARGAVVDQRQFRSAPDSTLKIDRIAQQCPRPIVSRQGKIVFSGKIQMPVLFEHKGVCPDRTQRSKSERQNQSGKKQSLHFPSVT